MTFEMKGRPVTAALLNDVSGDYLYVDVYD
ncbi:hypothetical protein SAMN05216228_103011 [Rhizobium tibeticum]|uniref:Uncharacterized protein n=1 Tax=Rhizobium tibeticum TaxID=501024 RepID=A0A1H8TR96_9HYPH|nr:hypothetical protein RTCCBAU85039_5361 [Rhizobium tibeticum]SEO93356.1 hypothetical protein SAMN05216228_103011 [Rhizobium tibeticum]